MRAQTLGILFAATLAFAPAAGQSQDSVPQPKPVPRLQFVPQPYHQAALQREGRELARYHFGPELRRPFLFPIVGPAGRSLTRMGHPRDPEGHSHHNSLWISHHDVGGVDFWGDRGKNTGRIVHQRVLRYEEADNAALMETANVWIKEDGGQPLVDELRRIEARLLAGGEWLLTLDLELRARSEPVTLGKTPFGIIGVRMAKTIGVKDGGGTIRNSEGGVNESGVFWKPARWVDYSGPITADASEGITLMDHPGNPNHPSVFHVRDDGWMGASLTYEAPRTLTADAPLVLRYGLYVHSGLSPREKIEARYGEFAGSKAEPVQVKR
jgi:hypothetical protein